MRFLPASDIEPVQPFRSTGSASDPSLRPQLLRQLGDRLRAAYDMAEEPVPVRMTELVEQLSQRLRSREDSPATLDAD